MDNDSDNFPVLRNTFDLNSRIMLTAIIFLSAVVLLVITLHVYARCVLRRQSRRRRQAFLSRIRSLGLTTSDEPLRTGLDPMVISSLPMFLFKQISTEFGEIYNYGHDDGSKSLMECSVCLSMLEGEEMVRLLPNCKHVFHAECIDKWLGSHSTCPLCRMEAEPPRLQPEPREGPVMAIVGSSSAVPSTVDHQALDMVNSSGYGVEGTTDGGGVQLSSSAKIINGGSSSRLSSFHRILSRERSMSRVESREEEDEGSIQDLERQ